MISYTRNFEDVMLVRALRHIQQGFYVDVGASNPVVDSNTYALYQLGWRGIAVEPQLIFNELWQQHRPQDMLVNVALADVSGEAVLFKPNDYGQGATINTDFAKDYARRGLTVSEHSVAVHTMTQVLDAVGVAGDVHLLSIDVEGAEAFVLRGLDWSRYRPWLIVIESTVPGAPTPNYEAWESYLLAQGYEFAYFDAVNRFYVASEHIALKAHFALPPCVWDDFVGHELQHLRERIPQLEQVVSEQQARVDTAAKWMFASALRFEKSGDMAGFETLLWRIFEIAPHYEDVYWSLGHLLVKQGRRAEALAFYEQTVQHAPNNLYSYHNIGMLLRWEKRFDESMAAFRRMMTINPHFSEGRVNFGALLLAMGQYEEGWALFESRYLVGDDEPKRMSHNAPFPRWTGESLRGKSIIVFREQGYGDEIMFARFVPTLKSRGAMRVTILCQPAIKTLLQTVPGVDDVVCVEDMNDVWTAHDYWCYGQSLPSALGITLDNLPAPIPYLASQPALRLAWRSRIANQLPMKTLKVGIAWRGSPEHGNDHNRSLKSLAVLRQLWDVQGVSFVSVQTGEVAIEARSPPLGQPLVEWGSQLKDFADGAALVSELDLIISVDTAIVHVAGALGVPCWVMIPRVETDWRWLNDRDDSPWYPVGMRIFRQTSETEWDDVLISIKHALQNRVSC